MSHFDIGALTRTSNTTTWARPAPVREVPTTRPQHGARAKASTGAPLPGVVEDIAQVIGRDRALFLIGQLPRCIGGGRAYPGRRPSQVVLYVPRPSRLRDSHPLVRILGPQDAMTLCEAFGGELLKPATCEGVYRSFRDRSLVELAARGVPVSELAEIFGLTQRRVRMLHTGA
jgi:hypothetical protein